MNKIIGTAAALAAMTGAAEAHPGTHMHGFADGFLHPFSGVDHILVMVAVGLLAARLGGKALFLVPLSFLSMMAIGIILPLLGITLPGVEAVITLSIAAFGVAIAINKRISTGLAMAMSGAFAMFHGMAHGLEIPDGAYIATMALGFVAATAILHGTGLMIGLMLGQRVAVLH
jgi:urease accessory protein